MVTRLSAELKLAAASFSSRLCDAVVIDVEMTLFRLLIVPRAEDGVAIKPDLQDVLQFAPIFRVKLPVLAVLFLPFLRFYDGAGQDDQVPTEKCVLAP